jgi:hypothetical protein
VSGAEVGSQISSRGAVPALFFFWVSCCVGSLGRRILKKVEGNQVVGQSKRQEPGGGNVVRVSRRRILVAMGPKKEENKKSVVEEEEEAEEAPPPPPPPPPPPGPGFYSVWAESPDVLGMLYDPTLHLIMTQLKEQHEAAAFSPHVTIMGSHWSEFEAAESNLKALCASTVPFTLKVKGVESGETYFQCVYLLMDKSDEVIAFPHPIHWFCFVRWTICVTYAWFE